MQRLCSAGEQLVKLNKNHMPDRNIQEGCTGIVQPTDKAVRGWNDPPVYHACAGRGIGRQVCTTYEDIVPVDIPKDPLLPLCGVGDFKLGHVMTTLFLLLFKIISRSVSWVREKIHHIAFKHK